eukprot:UN0897
MTQFLKDRASDSEEVVTPLMPDGTYLSRNSATLGPMIRQPPCESNHKSLQTHAFQCPQANYHSYARVIICRSRR